MSNIVELIATALIVCRLWQTFTDLAG